MSISERRNFLKMMASTGLFLAGCRSFPRFAVDKSLTPSRVGWYWNPASLKHTHLGQAESSLRAEVIQNALFDLQKQSQFVLHQDRFSSEEELALFHTRSYIQEIRNWDGHKLFYRENRWSPYSGPYAYAAASSAVAAVVDLIQDVNSGKLSSGFATIRPPGHHAMAANPMGYCIFNNVAVGVKSLQQAHPDVRVAIVDIDAHHGNGIQEAFYRDGQVLYISVHQDEWPRTGKIEDIGEGPGRGTTMNIPLPAGSGDKSYQRIFSSLLAPMLRRFQPNIIVVPLGFDTHWRDPQSFLTMSSLGQAHLAHAIRELSIELCAGKVAFVLEGGYQLEALHDGVVNTFNVLSEKKEYRNSLGSGPMVAEDDIGSLLKKIEKLHQL